MLFGTMIEPPRHEESSPADARGVHLQQAHWPRTIAGVLIAVIVVAMLLLAALR